MEEKKPEETIEEYTARKQKEQYEKFQRELKEAILREARKLQPDEKPQAGS